MSENQRIPVNNQKFGQFLFLLREERGWTQSQLAEKLNVADREVSKWECGIRLPDIKMTGRLAELFGVSILEMVCSEKINECVSLKETADEVITNVIAAYQKKVERRGILISIVAFVSIVMMVFLIDAINWEGFIIICLPVIMLVIGIYLIGLSIYRARKQLKYWPMLLFGMLALSVPVLKIILLCLAFVSGGLAPS